MEKKSINSGLLIALIAVVVIGLPFSAFAGFRFRSWLYEREEARKKAAITATYIGAKLQEVSNLTTAEVNYRGLIQYEKGSIPILTQKSFSMVYDATVRAGIDVSEIQVEVTDTEVILTMPQAEVQSIYIDPNSVTFYDQKQALLNWTDNSDSIDALKAAEEDVMEKVDTTKLTETAEEHSKEVIRGLLEDAIGDRDLVIR